MIKYLTNKLFISLTILLLTSSVNASHFNGYDISFKHISGRTYEFNLEFYDFAASPPDSVSFDVFSLCGNAGRFSIYNQMNTIALPPACSLIPSPMSKTSFSGNFTFPVNGCSDFTLFLDLINHNYYTNVVYSNNRKEIVINGVDSISNSSPKIINIPKYITTTNSISSYNLHSMDPDGDSLVYKLTQPPGNLQIGYTTNNPFGINQFCSLDSSTGILRASASSSPLLLSVEIEEYRNQTLISKTHRVWSLFYLTNNSPQVLISELNYNQGYDTTFCVNDTVFFQFKGAAGTNPAIVTLDSNKYNATITTINGISHFKLFPNGLFKTNEPYHFYVNAISGCNTNTEVYTIRFDSCLTTSLQENVKESFTLYPNPTNGELFLSFSKEDDVSLITIRSFTGQVVSEIYPVNKMVNINLSSNPPGIYFISVKSRNSITTKKVILTK